MPGISGGLSGYRDKL